MPISVLVPVDDSIAGHRAIQYIIRMKERMPMSVVLLTVIPLSQLEYHGFQPDQLEMIKEQALKVSEKMLERYRGELEKAGIPVETRIEQGHPAEMICRAAAHEGIDLVIISPNSTGKLSNLMFGSVAFKVVQECQLPVLLVR